LIHSICNINYQRFHSTHFSYSPNSLGMPQNKAGIG
jgi:hypothetical protein